MHKKFQTQLQDYLKDLTATGDPTPEPEAQQDTDSDGVQGEGQSPDRQSVKKQNSPKKSLSLPSFSSLKPDPAVSPEVPLSASEAEPNGQPLPNGSEGSTPPPVAAIEMEAAVVDPPETIAGVSNLTETKPSKPKKIKKRWLLGGALLVAIAGTVLALPKAVEMVEQWRQEEQIKTYEEEQHQDSEVLRLALLPPAEREARLQAIAAQPNVSLERSRARYLLAEDLLGKYEGGPAVRMLENLEVDYPILGPYVLLMRGRGYQLSNENIKAQETWQEIIEKYPDSPLVVNALANLGTLD